MAVMACAAGPFHRMNCGTKGEGRRAVAIAFQKAPKDGKPGLLASDEEIARLVEHARRTDEPPAYVSDTVVEAVGEHLHEPIHWTGRQWAVTDFGVEARNGTYSISKRRLWNEEADWAGCGRSAPAAGSTWPTSPRRCGWRGGNSRRCRRNSQTQERETLSLTRPSSRRKDGIQC